ncbi:MAG: metal-dependent hydrolase [Desulfovibrionaceae bacterium]|nr:metal-dependent hydrolase [Desulfovibrionaceae bacterium]
MTEITWYGHSAFQLTCGGVSVLIDPFLAGNPTCPVSPDQIQSMDIVLVTHDHGDHCGQAAEICQRTGAMLGAVVGTAEKFQASGLPAEQIFGGGGFNMGGTVEHKGVQVTMLPAFHTSESGTPVGYILTMPDGKRIYHAGDTCIFGDMALWGHLYPLDVALLPIGGFYTMDAFQAAMACKLLQCKKVIPMHWGTFPVLAQSTLPFRQELKRCAPSCLCIDMQPNSTVTL